LKTLGHDRRGRPPDISEMADDRTSMLCESGSSEASMGPSLPKGGPGGGSPYEVEQQVSRCEPVQRIRALLDLHVRPRNLVVDLRYTRTIKISYQHHFFVQVALTSLRRITHLSCCHTTHLELEYLAFCFVRCRRILGFVRSVPQSIQLRCTRC
jgi:hypothetical protein